MAAHSPGYLAKTLNSLLRGRDFYEHWKEKFRDPKAFGDSIKCHCPFHLGEGFRSFLLDVQNNTFRCTFTQCKAAFAGNLPQLHALLIDKPLVDAILDLIATFKLDPPPELRLDLAEMLAEHARELMQKGSMDMAENAAVLALKENPTNTAFRLLLAEICEQRNRPADAIPYYTSAVRETIDQKDWGRAEKILERLRALGQDTADHVEKAAQVATATGSTEQAIRCYLDLAGRSDTSSQQQADWLEKARALDPAHPEVLQRLAETPVPGADEDQTAVWESLLNRSLVEGQPEKALEAIERLRKINPQRTDLEERRAELLLSLGKNEEGVEILRTVAEQAREGGSPEKAERCLRRICDVNPEDSESLWQLMLLLEADGRTVDATFVADRILAAEQAESPDKKRAEVLRRLKQWHPTNIIYRESLADLLARAEETDAALVELRELADICFSRRLTSEALQHLRTASSLSAGQPRQRVEIARLLTDRQCEREALAEYESLARDCLESAPDLAEEACRAGIELQNSHAALHELLFRILLRDRPDEAIEQCKKIVELCRLRGKAEEALGVLEEVKQALPDRVEPRIAIARIFADVGRPDAAILELTAIDGVNLSEAQLQSTLEITDRITQRCGDRLDLLQMLVDLYRARDDSENLVETLLRLAPVQKAAGANDAAEATYLEIFASRPEEPRALLGHAELVRSERGFAAAKPLYQRYVERLLSAGRSEEAVDVYLRCIDWAPEDVDFRRALGALLAEQGDFEGARAQWEAAASTYLTVHGNSAAATQCYEAILSRCPDDVDTRKNLARLHVQTGSEDAAREAFIKAADEYGARHAYEDQIATYLEALEALPENAELMRRLALGLQAAGRNEEATSTLVNLMAVQEEKGETEELIATLRSLTELTPERLELRERLAVLLAEAGDEKAAADHYRVLARDLAEKGEMERAMEARCWVRERLPGDVENRQALIELCRKQNDVERLKSEIDGLVTVLRQMKKADLALDLMEDRLALDPDDFDYRVILADTREEAGQKEAAAEDYCRLGETLHKQGEADRARQMFERALRLRPGDVKFRRRLVKLTLSDSDKSRAALELGNLAEAFFNAGESDDALDCCRQLLKIGRKDPDIHLQVARIYAKHGLAEKARDTYDRALLRCQRSKDDEKTIETLDSALADFPEAEDLWQKKIETEVKLGRTDASVSAALRLARMLRERQERPDRIETVYETALEAAEPGAELLAEVADFYIEQNRVEEATETLRRLADLQEAQDNKDGAIETLNRVCSFRPSDVEILKTLTRLSEEVGDYEAARDHQARLGAQYIAHEQWADAQAIYDALLQEQGYVEKALPALIRIARELKEPEREREYARQWTEYLENQGRSDEAIDACRQILDRSPDESDTLWKLADLYGRRGDGERQVASLLQAATICEKSNELRQATAARLQVQTLDPENLDNLIGLAELYRRTERTSAAIGIWREVLDALNRRGDPARFASLARRMLEVDGALVDVREQLAEKLVELDRTDEAADEYSVLGKQLSESAPDRAIKAYRHALQNQSGRPADRKALAGLLVKREETGMAVSEYFEAAKGFAKAGDPAHGVACLESILALEPKHRLAREMLIQMRFEAGESGQAVGEAVALADRALAEDRKEDAERILLKVTEAGPAEAALAFERLGDLYISEERTNEALQQLGPLVETARREGNHTKLISYLEKVCDLVPIDHEHRIELVELALDDDNLRKALEHFRKLLPALVRLDLKSEGDRIGQMLLAKSENQWDIKEEIARAYAQAQMSDLAAMTYLDMAMTARGEQDNERVIDFASSALGLDPDNIAAREMLFEANLTLGQAYEAFQHANALSRLYDEQDQPDKALAVARRMVDLSPDDPLGHERLTALLEKQSVEKPLFEAFDRLTDLYLNLDQPAKAVETLARHLVIRPEAMDVRRRYVTLATSIGEVTGLADEYAALIDDAVETGDTDEAAGLFEQAIELEPDNLRLRERWVEFLLEQERTDDAHGALVELADRYVAANKIKKATDLISAVVDKYPNKPSLVGKLADLLLLQNAKGRAIEAFQRAARLFLQSDNRKAAHAVLERILEIDPLDVSTRSALVESLLAGEETDLALQHSRILADQYAERNLLDLAESEYRRIVANNPDDLGAWQSILDIVEKMGLARERVSDFLLVADTLARRGLMDEAAQQYRKVIEMEPDNLDARRAYIEICLQVGVEGDLIPDYIELARRLVSLGQTEEAIQYCRRVLTLDPKNTDATKLIHQLQQAGEDTSTARVKTETSTAGSEDAALSPHPGAAQKADKKSLQEAVENYRQILKTKPDNAMVRTRVADLLHQLGEVEEAVEEWNVASEQFLERGELEAVITLCEKILKIDPGRAGVRDRLSRANLKKDSMAAIESAIESLEDNDFEFDLTPKDDE